MTGLIRTPIHALLVVNCISLVGSSITLVAIPWFVLETTGSASQAGLTGSIVFLPSFLAGYLIDRDGLQTTVIIFAAIAQVITVAISFNPIWARMADFRPENVHAGVSV